jgi:hypothetical protein
MCLRFKFCSSYSQLVMKFVPPMLSKEWNHFCICSASACKNQIKMQFSSINNRNLEKSSRTLILLDHIKHFTTKNLNNSQQKLGSAYAQSVRKCSNIKLLGKIERKEKKNWKIDQGHRRFWFRQKQFIIISSLCTFKISFKSVNVISMGGSQKEVGLNMLHGIMLARS